MSAHTLEGIYLAAAVCFILALKGLSGPKTARRGNLLGAAGALLAIISTFFAKGVDHNRIAMIVAIIVGAAVGVYAARGVKMTAMPQLVAAFNGVGGAAAAIVSIAEFHRNSHVEGWFAVATVVFSALVGFTSFTGSVLTFAKLQELITGSLLGGGRWPGPERCTGGALSAGDPAVRRGCGGHQVSVTMRR